MNQVIKCPQCGEPHTLDQCPRWRVPAERICPVCAQGYMVTRCDECGISAEHAVRVATGPGQIGIDIAKDGTVTLGGILAQSAPAIEFEIYKKGTEP